MYMKRRSRVPRRNPVPRWAIMEGCQLSGSSTTTPTCSGSGTTQTGGYSTPTADHALSTCLCVEPHAASSVAKHREAGHGHGATPKSAAPRTSWLSGQERMWVPSPHAAGSAIEGQDADGCPLLALERKLPTSCRSWRRRTRGVGTENGQTRMVKKRLCSE
jgi:hypothetical protein